MPVGIAIREDVAPGRQEALFADDERWQALSLDQLAREAGHAVDGIFTRHAAFLRSAVLISGVHAEVYRRGAIYSRELGDAFTDRLLRAGAATDQADPEAAVRVAFNAVISTLVLRTAYGPEFATPATEDERFLDSLSTMVRRYLFRP